MRSPRLLRIATIPASIHFLLHGQLRFFKEKGFSVFAASSSGDDVDAITKDGIEHFTIPFTRTISPIVDCFCLLKLVWLIVKLKPDIVHTHTPKAGLLGMMAAWYCGVKVRMHTVAGLPLMESKGFKRRVLFLTEKITYACATHVYPNSRGIMDYITSNIVSRHDKHKGTSKNFWTLSLSKHYCPLSLSKRTTLKIIGNGSSNGIDTAYFAKSDSLSKEAADVRARFHIGQNEICFCFVGRLVRDKGIVELVEAFRQLSDRLNVKLLLVGSFENDLGPLPKDIFKFINQSENVILTGFQRDVRPFMLAANAFVFPSYREGFPNVVLQACSLGIPCIATDINGCNEIIQDGFSGRLVKPKSVQELYDSMFDFTKNQNDWSIRAQRAQEFVVNNFDRKKFWDLLLAEYMNLYEKNVLGRA